MSRMTHLAALAAIRVSGIVLAAPSETRASFGLGSFTKIACRAPADGRMSAVSTLGSKARVLAPETGGASSATSTIPGSVAGRLTEPLDIGAGTATQGMIETPAQQPQTRDVRGDMACDDVAGGAQGDIAKTGVAGGADIAPDTGDQAAAPQ